ncbi:MAG: hypothetical protein GX129_06875 [Clostridiales bacterium]|nr:hypothetical protein [Clostridiales bacterium]
MIKRNLLKAVALGLCMSALFAGSMNVGTAYAQSGGSSPAFEGTLSSEDSRLFEKQREMDQYLFVDHAKELEAMGLKVIYTGVADNYVEVGITPYNEEYAAFLYDKFGDELVKVVDTEEVFLYDALDEPTDVMPAAPDNVASPIMDMGDTPVSDGGTDDEALIKEREQLMADEEEELTIQITSIDGDEPSEDMDPEVIWQTGIVEDLPEADSAEENAEDSTDIRLVSAEDDKVTISSTAGDVENENKGLPTASIIAIVAAGILIIGGTAYTSVKKRAVKKY